MVVTKSLSICEVWNNTTHTLFFIRPPYKQALQDMKFYDKPVDRFQDLPKVKNPGISNARFNDWAELWVLICTVHLIVCSYHITYTFQSESTLYSCLNVNGLFAQNRPKILQRDLNVRSRTKWLWVRIPLQSLILHISHLFWARGSLTFRQL